MSSNELRRLMDHLGAGGADQACSCVTVADVAAAEERRTRKRQLEPRVSPRKLKQARREPKGGGGSSSSGGVKPGPAHRLKERRNDAEEKQSRALNELKKLGDYCSAGPRYYSLSK